MTIDIHQPSIGGLFAQPGYLGATMPSLIDDICASRHKGNPESVAANKRVDKTKAKSIILDLLMLAPRSTIKDLCKVMGTTPNAISGRLSEAKREGLIRKVGVRDGCAEYEVCHG